MSEKTTAQVHRKVFVFEDGETWTSGDCFVATVNKKEYDDLCNGAIPWERVPKDRWQSFLEVMDGDIKVVSVAVNPRLLKLQRNAVLDCLDEADNLAGQDGTSEYIDRLDGVVSMMDTMLDLAEES